jgi:hypothetical protein
LIVIQYMIEQEIALIKPKMNFNEDTSTSIMNLGDASQAEVEELVKVVEIGFLAARVRENLLNNPPGPSVVLDPWTEAMYSEDCCLKRGRGRPQQEALLQVFYMVGQWWDKLPARHGKRTKWRPRFYREDGTALPQNDMADLLLVVARACHPAYTASNCSAVADRARLDARSGASKLKRKALNAKHVAAHKARKANLTSERAKS